MLTRKFAVVFYLLPASLISLLPCCSADATSAVCQVVVNGSSYSLESISNRGLWTHEEEEGGVLWKYYFRICRNLGSSASIPAGCDPKSGGCVTRSKLGASVEHVIIQNVGTLGNNHLHETFGELRLEYANGSQCTGSSRYSTNFLFLCSESREAEGPRFVTRGESGETACRIFVVWETPAACPVRQERTEGERCAVRLPYARTYVSLKELDVSLPKFSGDSKYGVSFCTPLSSDWGCGNISNYCDVNNKKSGEVTNLTLKMERGSSPANESLSLLLSLKTTDGRKDVVSVSLKCLQNGSIPHLESVENRLTLSHPAICGWQEMIYGGVGADVDRCKLKTAAGKDVDLNLLFDSLESDPIYFEKSKSAVVNLCRPYEPSISVDPCHGADSSSGFSYGCVTSESSGQRVSLGRFWRISSVTNEAVIVKTFGGSKCPTNASETVQATLTFKCVAEHKEVDPDVKENGCHYDFTWKSSKTCPLKKTFGEDCKVKDEMHGWTYDFSALKRNPKNNQTFYVVKGDSWVPGEARVSLCGALNEPEECKGSGVCGKLKSEKSGSQENFEKWGLWNDKIEFDDGAMKLTYVGGDRTTECPNGTQSSIIFLCDETVDGTEIGPEFFVFSACTAHFLWRTRLACPPSTSESGENLSCKLSDSRGVVDLSTLAMTGRNYEVSVAKGTPSSGAKYILFNVCSRLFHGKGSRCPYDSAACLVEEDAETGLARYTSLGRADVDSARLRRLPAAAAAAGGDDGDGDALVLTYGRGDVCDVAGSKSPYYSVSARFVCDPSVEIGLPTSVGHPGTDPCEWGLLWRTKTACPVISTRNMTDVGVPAKTPDGSDYYPSPYNPAGGGAGGDDTFVVARGFGCKVADPDTGAKYDLSSLPDRVQVAEAGYNFSLSVCAGFGNGSAGSGLAGSGCFSGVGSCVKTSSKGPSKNAGWFSPLLELDSRHELVLHYVGGDDCAASSVAASGKRLSTKITFRCPKKPADDRKKPEFVGLKDCVFEFGWNTTAACALPGGGKEVAGKGNLTFEEALQRGKCMVRTNDSVVDLTALSSSIANYHFVSDAAGSGSSTAAGAGPWDYYLSVCRSLVPVPGLNCDPGAAACRGRATASSTYADVQSLGTFSAPPWLDANGDVHLTYAGGSKCSAGAQLFSTDIVFKCGAGLGMPELAGESPDCKVHLRWRSRTACPPPAPKPATKDCAYVDEERGLRFKLGVLRKDGYGYFVSERRGYTFVTYMLNVCDHCGGCADKNSAVCSQSMGKAVSFGRADKAFFLYRDGMLKLRYEGGDECETGEGDKVTEIWFECDRTADDQNAKPELYESYPCLVIFKWKTTLVCMDGPTPDGGGKRISGGLNSDARAGRISTGQVLLTAVAAVSLLVVAVACWASGSSRRRGSSSAAPSSSSSSRPIVTRRTGPGSRNGAFGYILGIFRGRRRGDGRGGGPGSDFTRNYAYRTVGGDEDGEEEFADGDSLDRSYGSNDDDGGTRWEPGRGPSSVVRDGHQTNYQLLASDSALIPLQDDDAAGPDLLVLDSPVPRGGNRASNRNAPRGPGTGSGPDVVRGNRLDVDGESDDDELLQL